MSKPESLRFGCQFSHRLRLSDLDHSLVSEESSRGHATMCSDLPMRYGSLLEQLDQVRAGHVQEIRGLLGRQFRVHRYDGDGIAIRHLAKDFQKQFQRLLRQDDGSLDTLGADTDHMCSTGLSLEWRELAQRCFRLARDVFSWHHFGDRQWKLLS